MERAAGDHIGRLGFELVERDLAVAVGVVPGHQLADSLRESIGVGAGLHVCHLIEGLPQIEGLGLGRGEGSGLG